MDFKLSYKTDYGIFIYCMLIMIDETDFVKGINTIAYKRIWDCYHAGGYQILSGQELSLGKKIISTKQRMLTADLSVIGQPKKYHKVWINEDRLVMFFKHMIHFSLDRKNASPFTIPTCKELEDLQKYKRAKAPRSKQADSKAQDSKPQAEQKKSNRVLEIPTEKELYSFARRIWWNCDYWINGGKIISGRNCNHHDPLEQDPKSGLSIWGWTRKAKEVIPATPVVREI
jgi:hypothetical protein